MLTKLQKYGALNSHDLLKFVAVILMVIDHVGLYFFPDELMFRAVGRTCVPIWFFFIGRFSPSKFDYFIVIYALAIEAANAFAGNSGNLDILFTIFITRLLLNLNEKSPIHRQGYLLPIALCIVFYPLSAPLFSYGSFGFMLAYIGYLQRIEASRQVQLNYAMVAILTFSLIQFWSFGFGMLEMLVSASLTAFLVFKLLSFELRKVSVKFEFPIKLISRYSLEVYALHLILFILIQM